jgi:23S rRNA (pseudouridine1915-N3)-methyltransferase
LGREIRILWAGRHRRRPWEALCEDYRRRIRRFMPVVDQPVKVKGVADGVERLRAEGRALLAARPDPSWAIALDSRGEAMTSEALADHLGRLRREWPHPVVFLIGSDLGLPRDVRDEARQVLALGPMTLSHELARLVLYEQLYRALSMDAGINYHRAGFVPS